MKKIIALIIATLFCLFSFACSSHQHTFSKDWSFDDDFHWHAATCGHDKVAGRNKHTLDNDGFCSVCKNQTSHPHQHIFSSDWAHDQSYHWHPAICDHTTEVTGKQSHSFVNGICSTCTYNGYTAFVNIMASLETFTLFCLTPYTYLTNDGLEIQSNENAYYVKTFDGETYSEKYLFKNDDQTLTCYERTSQDLTGVFNKSIIDNALNVQTLASISKEFNGSVDFNGEYYLVDNYYQINLLDNKFYSVSWTEDEKQITATVSYQNTSILAPHIHTFSNDWETTSTHHWYPSTCEHTEEKKDYGEHDFVNGSCTVCYYEKATEHTHSFSDELTYDEVYHYYPSTCGHDVRKDETKHLIDGETCTICSFNPIETYNTTFTNLQNFTLFSEQAYAFSQSDDMYTIISTKDAYYIKMHNGSHYSEAYAFDNGDGTATTYSRHSIDLTGDWTKQENVQIEKLNAVTLPQLFAEFALYTPTYIDGKYILDDQAILTVYTITILNKKVTEVSWHSGTDIITSTISYENVNITPPTNE